MDEKITRSYQFGVETHRDEQGRLHNLLGHPAVVNTSIGRKEYWLHGRLHNEGDEPAVEDESLGLKAWAKNGKLTRDGKPAVTQKNFQGFYLDGQAHNLKGPAAVKKLPTGSLDEAYAIRGKIFQSKAEWEAAVALEGVQIAVAAPPKKERKKTETVPVAVKELVENTPDAVVQLDPVQDVLSGAEKAPRKRRSKKEVPPQ